MRIRQRPHCKGRGLDEAHAFCQDASGQMLEPESGEPDEAECPSSGDSRGWVVSSSLPSETSETRRDGADDVRWIIRRYSVLAFLLRSMSTGVYAVKIHF